MSEISDISTHDIIRIIIICIYRNYNAFSSFGALKSAVVRNMSTTVIQRIILYSVQQPLLCDLI